MAEFKKLSAVEAVNEVADTANVLIEEDGVIKKAPKNEIGAQADWAEADPSSPAFIKNKPHKELVHEWNFSADDEVYELVENVGDDISWMAYKTEDSDFVIEYITYSTYYDSDTDEKHIITPYVEQKNIIRSSNIPYESSFYNIEELNFQQFVAEVYGESPYVPNTMPNSSIINEHLNYNYWYCYFTNHCNIIDEALVKVDSGGSLEFYEEHNPIKTVRIYKITY